MNVAAGTLLTVGIGAIATVFLIHCKKTQCKSEMSVQYESDYFEGDSYFDIFYSPFQEYIEVPRTFTGKQKAYVR